MGPSGGYYITEDNMNKILISRVVEIFDGDDFLTACVLGLKECNAENPCAFHYKYTAIRERIKSELAECKIIDIAMRQGHKIRS